jgi:hypothetical protein
MLSMTAREDSDFWLYLTLLDATGPILASYDKEQT